MYVSSLSDMENFQNINCLVTRVSIRAVGCTITLGCLIASRVQLGQALCHDAYVKFYRFVSHVASLAGIAFKVTMGVRRLDRGSSRLGATNRFEKWRVMMVSFE